MNTAATSNDEIVVGLEKSSAAMAMMGSTLEENIALFTAGKLCLNAQKCVYRTYLIAGNALEPFTTIARKLGYDGCKTKGLAVHAAKHPNVLRRSCGT